MRLTAEEVARELIVLRVRSDVVKESDGARLVRAQPLPGAVHGN